MRAFTVVFVLCTVFLSIFAGEILASQCPSCVDAESNACRRWGSGHASFQWASGDKVSPSISLTAGSCGQAGESAVGYIMLDCDTHSSICNGDGNPCDDGLSPDEAYAIVKVTGDKKAFQQVLGGISFEGDKVYTRDGKEFYLPTIVGRVGCEYKVPLESAGHARIKVTAGVGGCDAEFNGSRFNIEVKFFQQLSDQYDQDRYTLLGATKGSISVKRNSKRNFDPVNFKPDLRDGSSLSNKEENYRAYTAEGGQSEWKLDYRGGSWNNCESTEGWCGEVRADNDVLVPEAQTFHRVKSPGWKEATNGLPPYAGNTGWNYDQGSNHLSYSMGGLGTMYYHCQTISDGSVRIRTVERCDEGEDAGEGDVEWTVVYDEQDRIKYIHNASYSDPNIIFDPNDIDNATQAYVYAYETGGNDPNVTFQTRSDTQSGWTADRQWSLEFDNNGQATKFIGGCSSGCSGSGSFEHIEYDPTYTDQILWQKNAAGEIILQNEYQVITYGDYEDAGWVYIPDSGFESQNVSAGNCETFDENQSSWSIDVDGTDDSTMICDPNSGTGQYLKLDGTDPDTLYQKLWSVRENTVYDLDVKIQGHEGINNSYAMITLYAVRDGSEPVELEVIDANDFDLTDGDWDTKSLRWDSTDYSDPQGQVYLISNTNPWYLQLEVTGDKVDIDEFHMATNIWVGDQTKAIVKKQERINPATGQLVKVLTRDYIESSTPRKMTERQYVSSNVCRVTVYEYEDEAFTNIIKKTEYDETGTDTSIPTTGSSYVTIYNADDPNEIYITYAPNGKRADYQRYENGNLVESYVIDRVTDANSLRETYTYKDVEGSENYFTQLPDWRLETHTNARGGVTEYQYMTQNGTHLLEKQIAPATSAGQQEVAYIYDDARRVIKETRKLDNDRNLITEYNYNSVTGYLDSMTVGNATTTYRYNSFGQVIRQFNPDGVMTGKSYGMGGELLSEFVIAESSDPNDVDTSLMLISQTRYTYTDGGQIEQVGKYKSNTSFSYQTVIDADSNNWIVTKYEYYSDGKKKKTIEDFGTGKTNLTTEYSYNYQGELEKVLYPTGKWIKTYRDGRGLVILEQTGYGTDNVILEAAYSYDANGNLQQQSNPDGSVQIYTYDNYDRLKRTYQGSTSGSYTENFYNNAGDVIRQITCESDGTMLSDRRMEYDVLGNFKSEWICADPNTPNGLNDLVSNYVYDIAGDLRYEIRAGLTNPDPNENPDPNDIVTEYIYDRQGRRTQTIDPSGIIHSVFYTTSGLPKIIVDPNDPQDPNAFITENFYDAYGRLEQTIDPMGHYTRYTYNSLNQITKQVVYDCNDTPLNTGDDFAVRQQRIEYDHLGNVTRQVVMENPDSSSAVTLGIDLVTDFVFDPNDGLLKQQKSYYGTTPAIATTTYTYDNIGRRIQTTDPEDNQEIITYYSDDEKNALVQKIEQVENDPDGANDYAITTFMLYDSQGRLSAKILDEDGDGILDSTDPNTSFIYDALDRLKTESMSDGIVTLYEYDGFGNVKTQIEDYVDGTPDIDHDRTTEYVYNRLNQQYQIKAYDPNDTTSHIAVQSTTYEYDKNGNATKITYPDNKSATYLYNVLNKVDTEIKRDGTEIYYWYDWRGRLTVESDDPDGFNSTGTPHILTEFKYDAANNLVYAWKAVDLDEVSESVFTYNGFGVRTSETTQYDENTISKTTYWTCDGSGNVLTQAHGDTTLTYTHDGLGRIKTIDKGNDEIVSYAYLGQNAQSIGYTDAQTSQNFYYDELGRIEGCQSIDPNNQTILDFQYTYDEVGNRKQCKYNHLATSVYDKYYYDTLNRLWKAEYAQTTGFSLNLNTESLSIDDLVLVASAWVENESTDYTDYSDYLTQSLVDPVNPVKKYSPADVDRVKDAILSLTKRVDNPQIKKLVRSITSVQPIAYDPDAPIYTLVEFGEEIPKNYTTETCKNDDGNIIAQIIYDNKGQMVLFAMYPDVGGTIIVTTSYDNKGNITSNIFATFDDDGNLIDTVDMLAQQQEATITESSLSTESMSMTTSSVMMSSTAEAHEESSEIFMYDHLGNRYEYTDKYGYVTTYAHNSVNQYSQAITDLPLVPDEVQAFSYDDNGNLENDGYAYTYDFRNRLIEVQDSGSSTIAEYAFDALGRRISKTVDSTTTYFFYDPQGRVIAEYEGSTPELTREYVFGNGQTEILAMITPYHEGDPNNWDAFVEFIDTWLLSSGDTGYDDSYDYVNDNKIDLKDFAHWASVWDIPSGKESDWYYLTDALGSVRGLVGGRFQRESDREFYNYDVYGQLSVQDGEESKSGNPYLFAGYRYDAETELYHTKYRTYDPAMGRWFQLDPIGYVDGMSLYEYVMSNPIRYIDPLGTTSMVAAKSEEAEAWKKLNEKYPIESYLKSWLDYLGAKLDCKGESKNASKMTKECTNKILCMVRAISWVESRHGTGSGNNPSGDPMQVGNPKDDAWPSITGTSPKKPTRPYRWGPLPGKEWDEIYDEMNSNYGADKYKIPNPKTIPSGHKDKEFAPNSSYFWGIGWYMYMANQIASEDLGTKKSAWCCHGCKCDDMMKRAAYYNGKPGSGREGDKDYSKKIKDAVEMIGCCKDK